MEFYSFEEASRMSAEDFWKLIIEPEINVLCIRETAAPEPVGGLDLSINIRVLLRTRCTSIRLLVLNFIRM